MGTMSPASGVTPRHPSSSRSASAGLAMRSSDSRGSQQLGGGEEDAAEHQ
jgi:hypothetical protein